MLSEAKAKVGHRLAMHLRVDLFRLRNSAPMVSFTFDDLPKSAATVVIIFVVDYRHGASLLCQVQSVQRAERYCVPDLTVARLDKNRGLTRTAQVRTQVAGHAAPTRREHSGRNV